MRYTLQTDNCGPSPRPGAAAQAWTAIAGAGRAASARRAALVDAGARPSLRRGGGLREPGRNGRPGRWLGTRGLLLAADPAERDGLYDAMDRLWEQLLRLDGIGWTTASKLLHLKWP